MGFFGLLMLGVALAMDAACVSMVNGMTDKRIHLQKALYIAFVFGFFQGGMTLLGHFAGSLFLELISGFDHWIALILLGIIGGKMLIDFFSNEEKDENSCALSKKKLYLQGVATSIDALAVGISLATLSVDLTLAVIVIFTSTFVISFCSVYLGKRFGTLLSKKAELIGALILIGIGVNIFLTHVLG